MRKVGKGNFKGWMDVDSDESTITEGSYRYALNIVKGIDNEGAVKNLLGNEVVSYDLPEGDNEVIGEEEDTVCNTLIYFVKNSNGDDCILRYYPLLNEIKLVFQSQALHFDNPIHSARVIDGKYLVWTDARWSKDGMVGNCPRVLDMELAMSDDKNYIYSLWFEDNFFDSFVTEWEFTVEVYDGSILENSFTFTFQHSGAGLTRDEVLIEFGEALIAEDITGTLSYEVCNNEIKILNTDPERRILFSEDTLNFNAYLTNQLSVLLQNIDAQYPNDDARLCLIKPAMLCEPTPTFLNTSVTDSFVFGKPYKFIARYIYKDGMTSAWSPQSYVPTNFIRTTGIVGDTFGYTEEQFPNKDYDTLKISLEDRFIGDKNWREIMEYVEIGFKTAEDEFFKSVGRIALSELRFDGVNWYYLFYDNVPTFVIASDDNGNPDEQTLKPYDFVPLLAESLEQITDDDGNSLIVLGNTIQGYEADDCVRATIEISEEELDVPADATTEQGSIKDFKSGGIYDVYVIYYDYFGRRSLAKRIDTVEIPWREEDLKDYEDTIPVRKLTVTFESRPPIWAHQYKIGISKNQRQSFYKQYPLTAYSRVAYRADENGFTNDGVTPSHHAFYLLYNYPYVVGNLNIGDNNYFFDKDGIGNVLTPADGDKIIIVQEGYNPGSTTLFPDYTGIILDVKGFWVGILDGITSVDVLSVFVDFGDYYGSALEPGQYAPTEIYRTIQDSGIVYELPGCYAVQNIGSSSRAHTTTEVCGIGDTYISSLNLSTLTYNQALVRWNYAELPSLYHDSPTILNDLGRGLAAGQDSQEKRINEFVLSDLLSPGRYSGINSFRSNERRNSKREFGAIRKIIRNDAVLLVIHQYASQPFYINKGQLLDASGNTALARTDRILNMGNELDKQLGTHHPESVKLFNGKVYCFDGNKGIVWRYTNGGGQYEISFLGMDSHFRQFKTIEGVIPAGIEPERRLYHIMLPNHPPIAFMEEGDLGGWLSHFSFEPDWFGRIGAKFITFKNGELYIHDEGDWNTFYGQTFQSRIEPVFKADFSQMKRYHVLRLNNSLWEAEMTTEESAAYGVMESRLNRFKFTLYEGDYWAEFLRDMEDPRFFEIVDDATRRSTSLLRGRELRSHSLTLLLSLVDNTKKQVLREYSVEYSLSQKTI